MFAVSAALDLIYPRSCAGCGSDMGREPGHLCWECHRQMQIVTAPFCSRCGDPAEGMIEHHYLCSTCMREEPAFDLARSAVRYRGHVRDILRAFKYDNMTWLSRDLGGLLLACVRTAYGRIRFDGVACVPLHPRRRRERSYNQAALLASELGRKLRLPLLSDCVIRVAFTETQTGLSATQRRENMRHAFAARHPRWIEGRTFLLVDDVMTTGATVNEVSRVLKQAGAAKVLVVTVARG